MVSASASHLLDDEWNVWKSKYEKKYAGLEDELFRRKVWEVNWDKVTKHNQLADQGLKKYTMAMNHFADMTIEEINSRNCLLTTNYHSMPKSIPKYNVKNAKMTKAVDWRDSNCVSPVKDQGYCGSCWAFATVGVIEALHCLAGNELSNLSEQQLVDCDHLDSGCCGGFPVLAMDYIAHRGIMKTEDYEYEAKQSTCQYDSDNAIRLNVSKYYILPDEENMASSVAKDGPITVGFAVAEDFMFYSKGIFDGECAPSPNHAIIVVGYGTLHCEDGEDDGEDYWIIKNSWGEHWGEEGFGKIQRNKDMCGISEFAASMELKA
ncbi:cathepsin H [Xenopus laevis]|uniref:Cathepsin H n=1 Tax=Xenopus laevis TaxID=8355 RepID=A1L2T8_XENLA|nr:cathepsin H [Xenopus laevis]AAI29704.1 LOC100036949 protein [Xenopus laevis]